MENLRFELRHACALGVFVLTAMVLAGCASVQRPAIVGATDWGSTAGPMPEDRSQTPSTITVHHDGVLWRDTDDPVTKARGLQRFSIDEKDWPDIPYHFLVHPDGSIFEARPIGYEADTNTDYDLAGHVGINVRGNYMEQRVNAAQLAALVSLCAWICDTYDIPPMSIQGHLDVAPGQTVCPGVDLHRYIADGTLQGWVAETLEGRTPEIEVKEALADGPTEFAAVVSGGP